MLSHAAWADKQRATQPPAASGSLWPVATRNSQLARPQSWKLNRVGRVIDCPTPNLLFGVGSELELLAMAVLGLEGGKSVPTRTAVTMESKTAAGAEAAAAGVTQNVTSRYLKKDALQARLEELFPGQTDFNIRMKDDQWTFTAPEHVDESQIDEARED
ncbi:hypothetical protein B0H63DRAFT_524536 [Podospora didyma]|uniref:Uncharacterized protein n=1 Tax=Podospora didyma TaxID=330526 RepID=A0AAE0NI34_9PEZI|nr:hypothetical protein B0H63DRAFT_524536 [Podospora didyma]